MSEEDTPPRSLQELLKISLKLTDSEMKEWETTYEAMSSERQTWLKEAMNHALKSDETELMINSLRVIKEGLNKGKDASIEELVIALEQLTCLCDTIDMAQNLHKLGGFQLLLPLLKSDDSELRWRAAEVIATAVQNNPFCQQACHELKTLPVLFHLLRTDGTIMVKVKALYALSRLVNNFDATESEFSKLNGFQLLCDLLQSEHLKLRIKSAFMLRDQLIKSKKYLNEMLSAGIVKAIELQLCLDADDALEHFVKLMYEILKESSCEMRKELLTPSLVTALMIKREYMEMDKERFQDEITIIDTMLQY